MEYRKNLTVQYCLPGTEMNLLEINNTEFKQNMEILYCFPDNNSSCRKEVRSGPGNILLFIVLSCVSVCTVFLNLLVIISISHFKQLHTPTNLLILSLAVADLLVGMFVMPVNIMQLIDSCWYLGETACSVFLVINSISATASLCSLVLVAVDRYIAVSDPLLYSTRITVCKTTLVIILGWSFAAFYVLLAYYINDHLLPSQISAKCYGECVVVLKFYWVIVELVVSFLAPCSIILILYSVIFYIARQQAKAVRALKKCVSNKPIPKLSITSEMKAAKTLSTVIFIYLACWIPYYVSSLSVESLTTTSVVWTVFTWIIYMNSSVNPLIYAIFYPWFRASVKYTVTCTIFESSSSRFNLHSEHF